MSYHLTGIVQAILFLLSISAVFIQLRFVRARRSHLSVLEVSEAATDNLSLGAVTGSFLAFYSFLLLSTATTPFAHYIFWSRLPACVLGLLLLYEFRKDYPGSYKAWLAPIFGICFSFTLLWTAMDRGITPQLLKPFQVFVLAAGIVLVGGQLHQLWLVVTRKRVGGLSLKARTLNFLKDISTVVFATALGAHQSWPLILVAAANAAVTLMVVMVGARLER